jgi:hypothetical protein
MGQPEHPVVAGDVVGTAVALHGGAGGGEPHVLVLTVAVVGLVALVAALVVGVDRLLAAAGV